MKTNNTQEMGDVKIKNIYGDELSLKDAAREISRMENPMMIYNNG